jgi:hypothetical protein
MIDGINGQVFSEKHSLKNIVSFDYLEAECSRRKITMKRILGRYVT